MRTHGLTLTTMNRKELREEHIKLWTWLSENPSERKWQYFDSVYPHETIPINECFCCELSEAVPDELPLIERVTCENCPIVWSNNSSGNAVPCMTHNSLYMKWIMAHTEKARSNLARQIANMWPEESNE